MEAIGHYGYTGPSFVGPSGIPHVAVGGATAVMGVAANSMPPTIEVESGYHEQHSDTMRLPTSGHAKPSTVVGGWQALNPATGSVLSAKQLGSVHQATPVPMIPDPVATLTIIVVICIAFVCVLIARWQVRCLEVLRLRSARPS